MDDVSNEELEALREEATSSMKMMGGEEVAEKRRSDPGDENEAEKAHRCQELCQLFILSSIYVNTQVRDWKILESIVNIFCCRRKPERTVTLNSLPMKAGATIATVDIRPSVPK